jgi:hypothetical protein
MTLTRKKKWILAVFVLDFLLIAGLVAYLMRPGKNPLTSPTPAAVPAVESALSRKVERLGEWRDVRIVLAEDSTQEDEELWITGFGITDPKDPARVQRGFAIARPWPLFRESAPVRDGSFFRVGDVNFDGEPDVRILQSFEEGPTGAPINRREEVWVFNRAQNEFERDGVLSSGCDLEFDPSRKQARSLCVNLEEKTFERTVHVREATGWRMRLRESLEREVGGEGQRIFVKSLSGAGQSQQTVQADADADRLFREAIGVPEDAAPKN